jgi:hypothetical protein
MAFTLVEDISGTECIGSSRGKIVNNFVTLETQIINLSSNTINVTDSNTIDFVYNNSTRNLQGSLKNNSIQTIHLQTDSVATNKLSAEAVTFSKLATLDSVSIAESVEPRVAKAWVVFDGTTTNPTIKTSFNVASVSKNNIGDYTISFQEPISNLDYSVSGISRPRTSSTSNTGFGAVVSVHPTINPSAYSLRIWNVTLNNSTNPTSVVTVSDSSYISIQIFG